MEKEVEEIIKSILEMNDRHNPNYPDIKSVDNNFNIAQGTNMEFDKTNSFEDKEQ